MKDSDFYKLLRIMRNHPYLIKFQAENAYAETLLNRGEIYMQSAQYYKELEMKTGMRGQGDIYENQFFNGFINIGMEFPIYCMYAVHNTQIENQTIALDKQVLDDFCTEEGYITLCKTNEFLRQFNQFCKNADWCAGLVQYGHRTLEADLLLLSKGYTAHFFKKEDLSYQQEFRIRINEPLERIDLSDDEQVIVKKNGEKYWRDHTFKTRVEIIHDISAFSTQYIINDLEFDGNTYFLKF